MEKTYRLRFSRAADQALERIDRPTKARILRDINEKLTTNPAGFSQPLRYLLKGHRKLRVGDYRVVFTLHEEEILVLVVGIGHRREVYE